MALRFARGRLGLPVYLPRLFDLRLGCPPHAFPFGAGRSSCGNPEHSGVRCALWLFGHILPPGAQSRYSVDVHPAIVDPDGSEDSGADPETVEVAGSCAESRASLLHLRPQPHGRIPGQRVRLGAPPLRGKKSRRNESVRADAISGKNVRETRTAAWRSGQGDRGSLANKCRNWFLSNAATGA